MTTAPFLFFMSSVTKTPLILDPSFLVLHELQSIYIVYRNQVE